VSHHEHIPDEQLSRLDDACDRFHAAWQSGERPRIEDFLADCGDIPKAVLTRELLATEMELLVNGGQPVPIEDYLGRFSYPGLVDTVYRQVVKDASSPSTSSSGEIRKLQQVRDYQLLDKLGEGGFGAVYKAVHTRLGKNFAIKILPSEKLADPNIVARFQREMKAVGALEHPNIVRATDAGEVDGCHFLVMEFVDGVTLAELVRRRGPLPVREACEIIRQAAVALDFAHANGLVHRDVKPSNLMLSGVLSQPTSGSRPRPSSEATDETETLSDSGDLDHAPPSRPSDSLLQLPLVKLLDLGLARLRGQGTELTADGQVIGTMDYMAPEQARRGGDVGPQADIYSLGCTLFALLAGRAPFGDTEHASAAQKILAHVEEPLPPLDKIRPDATPQLMSILNRMTAKNLKQRFATAAAAAEAIAPLAAGANLFSLQGPKPAAEISSRSSQFDPTIVYEPKDTAVSMLPTRKFIVPAGAVMLSLLVAVTLFRGWGGWGRVFEPSADSARSPEDRGLAARSSPLDPGHPPNAHTVGAQALLPVLKPTRRSAGQFYDSGQRLARFSSVAVALGDLDGDGHLDAVVAGLKYPSRVFLNDGKGTLVESGQELGNSLGYSVAIGDLDGDGDLDVFIASTNDPGGSYACQVWLNDGNGNFSDSGQRIAMGRAVNEVSLGDVDNDGHLDIVLSCWQGPVQLWHNNGAEMFKGPMVLDSAGLHTGVALGDLDGDGHLDLVISLLRGGVQILRNDGRGNFRPDPTTLDVDKATSVTLGDLDGDSHLDLFITTSIGGDRVFFNDGRGNFRDSGQRLGMRASEAAALADLDGDGDLDVITVGADWGIPQPRLVWHNDGRGNFGTTPAQELPPAVNLGLAFGDLNGDGSIDVFFPNNANQNAEVWFNQSVEP